VTALQSFLDELTSGDDTRSEAAISSLNQLAESALTPLLNMLDSSDREHRWWATRALAALDQPAALDGLLASLEDPDPAVRQCAALGLRHRTTPLAAPMLAAALNDPDRLVARLAADALASTGPAAIPSLNEALHSPDPAVRIEAARALANIQDPQTIPALFAALDDPSRIVNHWAEVGLERQGIGMLFFSP
jgi:HEAT repeat protein